MNIIKSYEKKFALLGQRRYVQGSSLSYGLFEAAAKWELGSVEKIRADIHSLLNEHGRYDLYRDDGRPLPLRKMYNALFHLLCDTGTYVVGLKGNGERVLSTRPYDEEYLLRGYAIDETAQCATLELQPGSPLLNVMIALNKKLLHALLPVEGYGQWLLSRYELYWAATGIKEPKIFEIQMVKRIGLRHAHSSVKLGETDLGSVYFSRNQSWR